MLRTSLVVVNLEGCEVIAVVGCDVLTVGLGVAIVGFGVAQIHNN